MNNKFKIPPTECPYCDSENFENKQTDFEGAELPLLMVCLDCKKTWLEFYKFDRIILVEFKNENQ